MEATVESIFGVEKETNKLDERPRIYRSYTGILWGNRGRCQKLTQKIEHCKRHVSRLRQQDFFIWDSCELCVQYATGGIAA